MNWESIGTHWRKWRKGSTFGSTRWKLSGTVKAVCTKIMNQMGFWRQFFNLKLTEVLPGCRANYGKKFRYYKQNLFGMMRRKVLCIVSKNITKHKIEKIIWIVEKLNSREQSAEKKFCRIISTNCLVLKWKTCRTVGQKMRTNWICLCIKSGRH